MTTLHILDFDGEPICDPNAEDHDDEATKTCDVCRAMIPEAYFAAEEER